MNVKKVATNQPEFFQFSDENLNKVTKIIPIGMFFRASSILLFALAIYFAYSGIHELHEGFEELASITPNLLIS